MLRPLFGDIVCFISAHMYFCYRTYFTIIEDLTIIPADQPNIEDAQLSFRDGYTSYLAITN